MVVSIQMTEEEETLAASYAKKHGMSLSEAIKRALFDAIEDEYDIALADQAIKEYEKDPTTISHEEMKNKFGLWFGINKKREANYGLLFLR